MGNATQRTVVDLVDLLRIDVGVDRAGTVLLTLAGELDHQGAPPFSELLARTWAGQPAALTVDLRGLSFINARGLACLLDASRTARERRVRLALLCRPGLVSRMVHLVGLGARVAPVPAAIPLLTLVGPPGSAPDLVLVPPDGRLAPPPRDPSGRHADERAGYVALIALDVALAAAAADVTATREVIVARVRAGVPPADHATLCGASNRRLLGDTTASSSAASALAGLQLSAREGPSHDARRLRETVYVRDLHHDDRWPRLAEQSSRQAARSLLSVPMLHEGEMLGVLTLHSDRLDAFDAGDRELGDALAARSATALGSARIRDSLQQAVRSRDVIGQGKGILMARYKISAQQAFDLLSQASQNRNVRVADLAEELCRTGEL